MNYKKLSFFVLFVFLVSGCASVNDALTPSLSVMKDDFDGAIIVRQPPVSAASSMSEGWNTLGFEWNEKSPNTVFITVGTNGTVNITGVAFNADGYIISDIKPASTMTEYGKWSTRRFSMSWQEFLKIAAAKTVKMKVIEINNYTVSSFGNSNPDALVNTKISPFIAKVKSLRRNGNENQ